ncbi:helix-turn-helix transcriptional regulator [Nocardia vaccinii]|uniref:helix-turn-helix transcriptional regulator n=1 Tax=Nocardia vaccinii TaxID=1822 RepID=UPI0014724BAA|nr:helix-turn-helix transcriptional regulator [Nocardia vaccinii]
MIAAMRTASGPRLAGLGRQLADLLEHEQALREREIDVHRCAVGRLQQAVTDLVTATSSAELLRRTCAALAGICSARLVLASSIESGRARPIASYESGGASTIPASYRWHPDSAESRAVVSGNSSFDYQPAPELRDLFPQGCTVIAVSVDEIPVVLVHITGKLAAAQHDSATLLLEMLGNCLRRLGLSARRARQLELLRSSGIAREHQNKVSQSETESAPPTPWGEPLTERESEVLRLILEGASNTAVATELVITVDTVKSHVKRILRKLGATNRRELIARHAALTNRSLPPPSP